MSHLDKRISALVDGELGHDARDRALAHVAHCAPCRERLAGERAVKERLGAAGSPRPSGSLVHNLLAIGEPVEPSPAPPRSGVLDPVVPPLPPRVMPAWRRRPRSRTDPRRPAAAAAGRTRRTRHAAAGAVSAGVAMLALAFAAGGSPPAAGVAVVPPAAELSVEHAATTSGLPLRDPAFDAVTASVGGLSFAPATATVPSR